MLIESKTEPVFNTNRTHLGLPYPNQFTAPHHYTAKNEDYKALLSDKLTRQYFMEHIGFGLSKIEPGYIEGYGVIQNFMLQQDGFIHGGMISTLQDIVTGFAAFSLVANEDRVVTSSLNVSYLNPGKGDMLVARGWVEKPGSRLMYCESELFVLRGEAFHLIAKCNSIMAVIVGKNKQ